LYNQLNWSINSLFFSKIYRNAQGIMTQEKIGRYKIISELGRGGMATVFHASDPSFERDVAIKVLPRAFLHDPQFRTRFEREAKTVAALEHAAIVPVYDFGEEDGQPYIVMRLMSGGSLADRIKNINLSIEEASAIITRLAPALDAAHAKGIIHRDLKPGNILFDQYNNAFLSDFGIARITEAGATLTGSNILGTPAYMSPEQVQGDKDLDGRSDLYSMGVIFYQMLVGNTPYQATTPAKVMMMHILEPVPNMLKAKPDLPQGIKSWLEKVLAKEPEDRFQSAQEMADALQAALRGEVHPTLLQTSSETVLAEGSQQATILGAPATVMTPSGGMPRPVAPPVSPPPPVAKPKPKIRWLPITIGIVGVVGIIVVVIVALAAWGFSANGPFASAPTETATSTPTLAPPTATIEPSPTNTTEAVVVVPEQPSPTPSPTEEPPTPTEEPPTATSEPTATATPEVPALGGADLIAFIDAHDVWVMNVDGSELRQLTNDGGVKTNLGFTPDGTAVTYISGVCAWKVEIETGRVDHLVCFDAAGYFDAFSISPDGSQIALSLNRELYLIPFDTGLLSQAHNRNDLIAMSQCPVLSPYLTSLGTTISVKGASWSRDGNMLAILFLGNEGGLQVDLIRLLDITDCENGPNRLDEFPATRFTIGGYANAPYIQTFGYDGSYLFALVSYTRNDGFGDLYVYNSDLHRVDPDVNPVGGTCCYRDVQFSPDGRYIIFAYQPFEPGATAKLYYVDYALATAGAKLEPLPLPDTFFANTKEKPIPVLRPVMNGSGE
jgi:serine/threonine protein kinase